MANSKLNNSKKPAIISNPKTGINRRKLIFKRNFSDESISDEVKAKTSADDILVVDSGAALKVEDDTVTIGNQEATFNNDSIHRVYEKTKVIRQFESITDLVNYSKE